MKSIGEKIISLRKQAGLSQNELAHRIKMSRSKLAKFEINTQSPSLEDLTTICDFFNISLDYLVGRDFSKMQTLSEGRSSYQVGQPVLDAGLYEVVELLTNYPLLQFSLHKLTHLSLVKQKNRVPLITSFITQLAELND
ncbi:helix-turn-helix transcriptional regulator [Bacillus sp. CGMCC 1.16541]|uniref:helix-turn-helix domain-containing protein n=1 Tax=Bacillus sp. CGMCC 1.16541 TaxID=2185143 RepID=UPI000D72CA19|nr:helix-turn-helix transcriptional regulator [Bacillus sp. CGMCC 1.16541]